MNAVLLHEAVTLFKKRTAAYQMVWQSIFRYIQSDSSEEQEL